MIFHCAKSSDDYRDFFYRTVGLKRHYCCGSCTRWSSSSCCQESGADSPSEDFAVTFGNADTILCGTGSFTVDQDMMIEFDYPGRYLHFGILYEGVSYTVQDECLTPSYTPNSYLSIEDACGEVGCWKAGQKFNGVEVSVNTDYLTEQLLPALCLPEDALDFFKENVHYTPLSPELTALLSKIQSHLMSGSLNFAVLYAAVSTSIAHIYGQKEILCTRHHASPRHVYVGQRKIKLSPSDIEKIMIAYQLLSDRAHHFPTIYDLSCHLSISEQKLKAGFCHLYGRTIWNYANQIRMNRAVNLLKNSNSSIQDISLEVGYQSLAAFMHTFKKWSGMTPGKFRKMLYEYGNEQKGS